MPKILTQEQAFQPRCSLADLVYTVKTVPGACEWRKDNQNLLQKAALRNQRATFLALLDVMNFNDPAIFPDTTGNTVLMTLMFNEHDALALAMLEKVGKRIDYSLRDFEGKTVLIGATKLRKPGLVALMIACIQDQSIINAVDDDGYTALDYALALGDPILVVLLRRCNAGHGRMDWKLLNARSILSSVDINPDRSRSAPFDSVRFANGETIYKVVNRKAVALHIVNHPFNHDQLERELALDISMPASMVTADLVLANRHLCGEGAKATIKTTFKKLDTVTLGDECGRVGQSVVENCLQGTRTPDFLLRVFAKAGDIFSLQRLWDTFSKEIDIDNTGKTSGKTALHFAYQGDQGDAVAWLIAHGANENKLDNTGKKPSEYAHEQAEVGEETPVTVCHGEPRALMPG